MNLANALRGAARRHPDRAALIGEARLTFAAWDAETNRLARALAESGVRHGSTVALLMDNSQSFASCHLALQKLGAVSVPLNVRYAPADIAYCLDDCAPCALLTDDANAGLMASAREHVRAELSAQVVHLHAGSEVPLGALSLEVLADRQSTGTVSTAVRAEDLSVLLYTSGTTGRPKGVPRTHSMELVASMAHVVQTRLSPADNVLGSMPLYHTMGLRSLLAALVSGSRYSVMSVFDPAAALDVIERTAVSALYLVPTAFHALCERSGWVEACSSVRKLAFAGAPMAPTLTFQLADALAPLCFINHYGCTEIYTLAVEAEADRRPRSVGRAGLMAELALAPIADDGKPSQPVPVASGQVGEVVASLRSPEAFAGYWRRPDADHKALRSGFYYTGDLARVDEDGNLELLGRTDDMIISGGENIHPLEVENVLCRTPGVREVCVVGMDDSHWGQAVTAFVVPDRDANPATLSAAVLATAAKAADLARYKRPKRVVVVAEIPKSPVGKLLRRKLVAGEFTPILHADRVGGT